MANRRGAQNRRRRGVPALGAGPDYHYRSDADYLWMQELAWDLYRNNMALGSITDRAIEQHLQGGFRYDPQTGDTGLDKDIKQWWDDVSTDPKECDPGLEDTFSDQEEQALRQAIVPGDCLCVPLADGQVDIVEGWRLRAPSRKTRENIVHGIEYVPGSRRRAAYWVLKDQINPDKRGGILKHDLHPIMAWDDDGERNAWHMLMRKRPKQSRGVTAYAPLFDVAGYHDDTQFLKMVQARAASLFVFVRQRSAAFDPEYMIAEQNLGPDRTVDRGEQYEQNRRQYQEVAAGSTLEGLPAETITPWSSNVPNPEFFPHARMLLMFMGINLGMPLVMALMDASETNFSGYRGAVDQARLGFRSNQLRAIRRFHKPYIRFKMFKRAERDESFNRKLQRSLDRPKAKGNVFRGKWNPPAWPYIEPVKDATADLIRDANSLISPRRRCQERGHDWNEIATEMVDDRFEALDYAATRAGELIEKHDLKQDKWTIVSHLMPLPTPERTTVSLSSQVSEVGPSVDRPGDEGSE